MSKSKVLSRSEDEGMRGRLTTDQTKAVVCRDASVVLSSGAGCGKTHVLTERYLSHLREGVEVNQLVAITFTDRAARQMRGRIREAITKEVHKADADADRWARHLRNLETAQISTIHSFCAALLRQNAVEAGVDPGFEIIEDVLAVNLEAEALTSCLQALLPAESGLGADLRELVLLYGWPQTVQTVRSLMRRHDALAWDAWLKRKPEEIAAEWEGDARSRLLPAYVEYLRGASPKIAYCLDLLVRTECSGPLMRKNIETMFEALPCLGQAADLNTALQELNDAAKVVGTEKAGAWPSEDDYQAVMEALAGFRESLRKEMALFVAVPEGLPVAVQTGQRFLRVAAKVVDEYRKAKRRAASLDFQDLLAMARDLLRDHENVRAQLQRRYRYLLIDELQDTDPVQMELVAHLSGEGLKTGKLFAVGDHKQSIYRFRQADVKLFQKLRLDVPQQGRLDLSLNFRSQPAILHFVNALLGPRWQGQDYVPLAAHHAQANPGACVEFLWTEAVEKNVQLSRKHEAERIAARIAAMVGSQEKLVRDKRTGQLRSVLHRDIVLLFRAMSNVHLYETALRNHGIDYYLVGGRAFFAQQEIYDLLNVLRALENPQDGLSLAGALRSPFCCLSDEALLLLGSHPEGFWAGLHDDAVQVRLPEDQRARTLRARGFLDSWRGLKDLLPIATLLGRVLADSGYDAATQFEFLGDRKLANLWKLIDMARTFDRSGLFGLAEFIERLGDLVKTQPREEQAATQPENADVVRLMTIHQSKGLEFPVVFVPDLAAEGGGAQPPPAVWHAPLGCVVRKPADDDEPPFDRFAWDLWQASETIDEWHEDLRTLYVACTRAEDFLVLSSSLPPKPKGTWILTLAERFDLTTGACKDALAAERTPRVSVVDRTKLTAVEQSRPVRPVVKPVRRDEKKIAPIPVRIGSADVLPLCVLEEWLHRRTAGGSLESIDVAWPFAAEDGADRKAWLRPVDRLNFIATAPATEAGTPKNAKAVHHDVEFVLDAKALGAPPGELPLLSGTIDMLWEDRDGGWHLLMQTREPDPASLFSRYRTGLAIRACAIFQQTGGWPRSVTLRSSADGKSVAPPSDQLRYPDLLAEARQAISDLLGQRLPA